MKRGHIMTKEIALIRDGVVESLSSLGKYCLSAMRGAALMTGGIGGLIIVGTLLLLLVFPFFLLFSFTLKLLGF
jgi:hypothetical protein